MRILSNFVLLVASVWCVTHNNDGTGGTPPAINQYVMLNADVVGQYTGIDPHAVHGVVMNDNGYILAGFAIQSDGSTKYAGFVNRIDLCADVSQYSSNLGVFLTQPGTDCTNSFTWSYINKNSDRNLKLAWVAASPDGTYVLAAGVREASADATNFNGYIVKLDAATGSVIYEFDVAVDDGTLAGARSGFETIAFTEDGGFVVGGFMNMVSTAFPFFKSSGQVDDGVPVVHKFSAATASASSMTSNPAPEWTYKCAGTNHCQIAYGSAKALRVYKEQGLEKIVTVPGTRAVIIIINSADGTELSFKVFDDYLNPSTSEVGDGTASDIEVEFDANGNVSGFVTNGLDFFNLAVDDGATCAGDGCMRIRGVFTKYAPDLQSKIWQTRFNTGDFPGGLYQYAGTTASTAQTLVYTECFGLMKIKDSSGSHVGYLGSCGSGIEGCSHLPEPIATSCATDPRRDWRGTPVRIDLNGNIVWYRMDNFKDASSTTVFGSASEYIMMRPDGKAVSVTDETFGFGVLTYECEATTCSDSTTTTTTAQTTTTTATETETCKCETADVLSKVTNTNSGTQFALGGSCDQAATGNNEEDWTVFCDANGNGSKDESESTISFKMNKKCKKIKSGTSKIDCGEDNGGGDDGLDCNCGKKPKDCPECDAECLEVNGKNVKIEFTCPAGTENAGQSITYAGKCKKVNKGHSGLDCGGDNGGGGDGGLDCKCESQVNNLLPSGAAATCIDNSTKKKPVWRIFCDTNSNGQFDDGEDFDDIKNKCKKLKTSLSCSRRG